MNRGHIAHLQFPYLHSSLFFQSERRVIAEPCFNYGLLVFWEIVHFFEANVNIAEGFLHGADFLIVILKPLDYALVREIQVEGQGPVKQDVFLLQQIE